MASIASISARGIWQPVVGHQQQESPGAPVLLGESVAARRLRSQVRRIAPYFRVALIHGEPGTGKELVALCLHSGSPTADGPLIVEEAAAVAEPFGGGDGPGSIGIGAAERLLESAHGGTLCLRGVDTLSPRQQAELLRFLFAHGERPDTARDSGGARRNRKDARARILAVADCDVRALTVTGRFRQELYAYLSAVEVFVPPLRERAEDIPALAEWVLGQLALETGQGLKGLTDAAVCQLHRARWPGNLRELQRVLRQSAALAEGATIEPCHLPGLMESEFADAATAPTIKPERLHDMVQQHVLEVLGRCGGNKLRAAARLGISRSTLYRMLDAGGIDGTG